MLIYALSEDNMSPNSLRCSFNPRRYWLQREPGETNMSHEQKTRGWLGTTNDMSRDALGEFDTDDDDWVDDLKATVGDDVVIDETEILQWLDGDDEEMELETTEGELVESRSCTWSETIDDEYWPMPKEGWEILLYLNDPGTHCFSATGLNPSEIASLNSVSLDFDCKNDTFVKFIEASGVDYDDVNHTRYNSGEDWRYLFVRTEGRETAISALKTAVAGIDGDLSFDEIIDKIRRVAA